MGATPAQTMYDNIKADRLDPEKALVVRQLGGGTTGANDTVKTTNAQLTAPSSTDAVTCVGYKNITIQFVIAAIDTSVTLRAEGTLDGTNWFNLSPTNTDSVFTANGTNAFNIEATMDAVRLTMVSELGGTAVTVDSTVRVLT